MTTENSVLMNLNELFSMEESRRAETKAERARAEAEAEARREAERAAELAEKHAREEAERLRAAETRAAAEAKAKARIEKLRAELDAVRAQREELRLRALDAATASPAPRRGGWLAGSVATMSLVAACVAIFVAWPRPQAVMPTPMSDEVLQVETLETETDITDDTLAVSEPETDVEAPVEAPSVEETPVEVASVERPRPRPRPHPRPVQDDLSSQLNFDDDSDQPLSNEFLRDID